jgi:hypothetical protein
VCDDRKVGRREGLYTRLASSRTIGWSPGSWMTTSTVQKSLEVLGDIPGSRWRFSDGGVWKFVSARRHNRFTNSSSGSSSALMNPCRRAFCAATGVRSSRISVEYLSTLPSRPKRLRGNGHCMRGFSFGISTHPGVPIFFWTLSGTKT